MYRRFRRIVEDLIPDNIVVSNFYGKPSDSEGVICLDITMDSMRRPTMFLVILSLSLAKATYIPYNH